MREWWTENWVNVVSISIGVVGILLAVYFGFKGWKRKKPTYLIRSNNIFSGLEHTVPDVEVKFAGYGQPITSLTVTKVAFWNAGNETIRKTDVVKEDPITIQAREGIVLLSASVIDTVSHLNHVDRHLSQDRTRVAITFDYLDHNQGAIIQVFHTGPSDKDITMRGTIMGASPIRRIIRGSSTTPSPPVGAGLLLLCILWLVWGLFAALLSFGILVITPAPVRPVPGEPTISLEALGVALFIVTVVVGLVIYLYHIPKPFSKILRQ